MKSAEAKPTRTKKGEPLDNDGVLRLLGKAGACEEATKWVESAEADGPTLWATCPRGDWMLFIAAKLGVDRKLIVSAACKCARLALPHVPAGEDRPRLAIEAAERRCRGEATIDEVRAAASDAAYAAYAATAAAYAATAAAYATAAAAYAASAASIASDAAYAAYAASAASAGKRAREKTLIECAAIVRKAIPYESLPIN